MSTTEQQPLLTGKIQENFFVLNKDKSLKWFKDENQENLIGFLTELEHISLLDDGETIGFQLVCFQGTIFSTFITNDIEIRDKWFQGISNLLGIPTNQTKVFTKQSTKTVSPTTSPSIGNKAISSKSSSTTTTTTGGVKPISTTGISKTSSSTSASSARTSSTTGISSASSARTASPTLSSRKFSTPTTTSPKISTQPVVAAASSSSTTTAGGVKTTTVGTPGRGVKPVVVSNPKTSSTTTSKSIATSSKSATVSKTVSNTTTSKTPSTSTTTVVSTATTNQTTSSSSSPSQPITESPIKKLFTQLEDINKEPAKHERPAIFQGLDHISEKRLERYHLIFTRLDVNNLGVLNRYDFENEPDYDVKTAFSGFNEVNFQEFASVLNNLEELRQPMQTSRTIANNRRKIVRPSVFREYCAIYRRMDVEKTGHVSATELAIALRIPPSQAQVMLQEADQDGNGMLEFGEFISFISQRDLTSVATFQHTDDPTKTVSDGELSRYKMLFAAIDVKSRGYILESELFTALKLSPKEENTQKDEHLDFTNFVESIQLFEISHDKQLDNKKSFEEFLLLITKSLTSAPTTTNNSEFSADLLEAIFEDMISTQTSNPSSTNPNNIITITTLLQTIQNIGNAHNVSNDVMHFIDLLYSLMKSEPSATFTFERFCDLMKSQPTIYDYLLSSSQKQNVVEKQNEEEEEEDLDIPLEELNKYRVVFDSLDEDKSGKIDKSEIMNGISNASADTLSVEMLYELLARLDDEKDEELSFKAFARFMYESGDGATNLTTALTQRGEKK